MFSSSRSPSPLDTTPAWGGVDWGDDFDFVCRSAPAARVLVLDVDNIYPGRRRSTRARQRLSALLESVGPVDAVFAAGNRVTISGRAALLNEFGISFDTVPCTRDAADLVLLERSRAFAAEFGDVEFFVASDDHAFAQLAELGRLVVVNSGSSQVSQRLMDAADAVVLAA